MTAAVSTATTGNATTGNATARSPLHDAKRIVVKIGSALLVEEKTGAIHRKWLDALIDDIADLKRRGKEVLIVSSGAIAVGKRHLGITSRDPRLEEKQAAAATGQIRLAHAYQESLARHGVTVAQILLSPDDTENRRRHLNARETIATLLEHGAVPVINENDTVATAEIRFGDNDRLGARVAQMTSADTLILLSDIDGLYESDPRRDENARHIAEVERLTPEIEAMAGPPMNRDASGGMVTKLMAARIATSAGCRMAIARGNVSNPLAALEAGARCTWFAATANPRTARKAWIAGSIEPRGVLHLDAGAAKALKSGKSLLPAGIVRIEGEFHRGDLVGVHGPDGGEMARGLAAYSSADAALLIGHKSREIESILGYRGRDEMIHRDDLVLI